MGLGEVVLNSLGSKQDTEDSPGNAHLAPSVALRKEGGSVELRREPE